MNVSGGASPLRGNQENVNAAKYAKKEEKKDVYVNSSK